MSEILVSSYSYVDVSLWILYSPFSYYFLAWMMLPFKWVMFWALCWSAYFWDSFLPLLSTCLLTTVIYFAVSFILVLASSICFSKINWYSSYLNSPSLPWSLSKSFSITSIAVSPLFFCIYSYLILSSKLKCLSMLLFLSNNIFLLIKSLSSSLNLRIIALIF